MAMIRLTHFSHDELLAAVEGLAGDVERDGWKPALLVGIGRGGLAPAVYLSHRLRLPLVSVDHSAGIPAFGEALITALAERTRAGERLLIVEDINDSGQTIRQIRAALAAARADAEALRFAVLIDNCRSIESVDYRFRTIDRRETKDWFVFPWEAVATRDDVIAEAQSVPERLNG